MSRRCKCLWPLLIAAAMGCSTTTDATGGADAATAADSVPVASDVSDVSALADDTSDLGDTSANAAEIGADPADGSADVEPGAPHDVSIYFWNLWDNALQADNRAKIVSWAPDIIFLSDAFDADDHALLAAEGGFAYGHHTGENFAVSSQLPLGAVEVIHHAEITKRILHVELTLSDALTIDVFEVHLKNPTHASKDFETQKTEVVRVLEEIGQRTGHMSTVVIGDLNARSPEDGATEYINAVQAFLDAGYSDAWLLTHPGEFVVTKIARSLEGSRIDYVMVSPDLVDRVVDAGAELDTTYPEHSDHRAVFATLRVGP